MNNSLSIDNALKLGIESHKNGNIQEAERYYSAILKVQPDHTDANHNMGVILAGVGNFEQSFPFFKRAKEINPKSEQFWVSLIEVLIRLNKKDDALMEYRRAEKDFAFGEKFKNLKWRLNPELKSPSQNKVAVKNNSKRSRNILDKITLNQALRLAKKKISEKDFEEARKIYSDILKRFPRNKRASNGIKEIKNESLIKNEKNASLISKKMEELVFLYEKGQFREVLKEAESLNENFPNRFDILNLIGLTTKELGELDKAVESLELAISIQPGNPQLYFNLANTFGMQGHHEKAVSMYNKALKLKPDYTQVYLNLGNTLRAQDKIREELELYKNALLKTADSAEIYCNMANALVLLECFEEAFDAYDKALKLNPNDAEIHCNIANAFVIQNDDKKAKEAYAKALLLDRHNVEAKHMMSALVGEPLPEISNAYAEKLFNNFSSTFDNTLINKLKYETPKRLAEIAVTKSRNGSLGSVLDLGCGTGLQGLEIKNVCESLEGIDISNGMLHEAKLRNIYHKLTHIDIFEYLEKETLDFDYVFSTDVFNYIGDVSQIFNLIVTRNKRSGRFIFSTEHTEKAGFHLQRSGRYAHSQTYIEELCAKYGFRSIHFSINRMRKERGQFIAGGYYVLEF